MGPTPDDKFPAADLRRVVETCERFEAAWNAGTPLRIEDILGAEADATGGRLLRELVALELELRRRAGQAPGLDEYEGRFPGRDDDVRAAFGLAMSATSVRRHPAGVVGGTSAGYEVVERLGRGGQAETLLARDLHLRRLVVLKRYHTGGATGLREAVLAEGRALARVRSRYVVTCHAVVPRDDGVDLVLEYVPGRPLSELPAGERADLRRMAGLVAQVAEGLAEVHACGLLHRDLKPQNVLLGDDGAPRLVDFGLAAPLASPALEHRSGSPPYMAPEQARGQAERVGPRTDVFGLGAVLYFLLTGRPPFPGKTPAEALEAARAGVIVPPREINPRVPRPLERVCMKALAADPKDRYASAEEFRKALVGLTRVRPRAAVAAVTALGLLALLTAGLALGWLRPPPDPQPPAVAVPTDPGPLDGRLEVLAWTPQELVDALRLPTWNRSTPITDGVLPLRKGEQVRLVARLDRPAFVYLVWIDGQGKPTTLYPRAAPAGGIPQAEPLPGLSWPGESKVRDLKGPSGRESAILLARQTPLPPGTRVEDLLKDLPAPRADSGPPLEQVKIVGGREVPGTTGRNRGLGEVSHDPDDPLSPLLARLKPHFELIHVYRFAYEGGTPF